MERVCKHVLLGREWISTFFMSRTCERIKWTAANVGWPMAFVFWFQIIVVLYASIGDISLAALLIFFFLWIIITCSYFAATFTPPVSAQLVVHGEKDDDEEQKYCDTCQYAKPSRWHHCRRCQRCVHRMDHHCPILQMCIHRTNHKYFLLFLIWPVFLAIFTIYHGYMDFWKFLVITFSGGEMSIEEHLRATGVSNAIMVGIAAVYLLREQIPNLLRNQTLIEDSREDESFDLGSRRANFESIMGPIATSWLPIQHFDYKYKCE